MREVREDRCPVCGERVDSVTGIDNPDVQPSEGDVSICFYCASVLRFGPDLELRAPDAEELRFLKDHDPNLHWAQEMTKRDILRRRAESN